MNSKLPVDVLGRVWDMSDIDADGMMDKDEFAVAMHLVYRAMEGDPVPLALPAKLVPPSKRSLAVSSVGTASTVASSTYLPRPSSDPLPVHWTVTQTEKIATDKLFLKADTNKDGLVAGAEVKDILMASGLQQPVLAHIWNLCDIKGIGALNAEQFALAMHLIKKNQNGIEPPKTLTPEMIPPSLRASEDADLTSLTITQPNDFSAIKELDKISTDIENLGQEKASLQQQISQTEEAVRKTVSEIEDSKGSLEKVSTSVVELRQANDDAKKRLEDVEKEKTKYETMLGEIRQQCKDQEQATRGLRNQIAMQETSVKSQEEGLAVARKELNGLREEESALERELEINKSQLEQLQKSLAATKQEIDASRNKVSKLTEENQGISAQIDQYTAAMTTAASSNSSAAMFSLSQSGDLGALPEHLEASFTPHPDVDQISARATAGSSPVSSLSGFSVGSGRVDEEGNDDFKDTDPFKSKSDPFGGADGDGSDIFNSDDPFKSDPFKSDDPFKSVSFADEAFPADPFREKDMFDDEGGKAQNEADPFGDDPFKPSSDDMTSQPGERRTEASGNDPFQSIDMFASDAFTSSQAKQSASSSSDPFLSDPFAPTTSTTPVTSSVSHDNQTDADPFGDPFGSGSSDPFGSSAQANDSGNPWAAFQEPGKDNDITDGPPPVHASEEEQIAWATKQSEKEEKKRLKKIKQLSKKEDHAFAIALKESVKSSKSKSKSKS